MQEYHTPPVMMIRMIEGPPAIVPVGDLKITQGRFDEEMRDGDVESGSVAVQMAEAVLEALGTRAQIPTGYMVKTLRSQSTCDSNMPSDQMLSTF